MAILKSPDKHPGYLAIADITTGEFYTTTFPFDPEILRKSPSIPQ